MQKAVVISEFVAQLFGIGCDEVMHDAFEIADAICDGRKGE